LRLQNYVILSKHPNFADFYFIKQMIIYYLCREVAQTFFTEIDSLLLFTIKLFPNLPPSFRSLLNLSSVVWHAKFPLQVSKSSRKSDKILKKKKFKQLQKYNQHL